MNDNSDFYTEDRALQEEVAWILHRPHARIIDWLLPRVKDNGIQSVIEFGCGSGIVAAALPVKTYLGIDSNQHFLRMAKTRCPDTDTFTFTRQDVRRFDDARTFDLPMAWSFFKHFGLREWNAIFAKVLRHGNFGAFNVQMANAELDDGGEYHHVHVSEERLAEALKQAGHKEVERMVLSEWNVIGLKAKDVAIWTRRL